VRLLSKSLIGSSLLLIGLAASAQDRERTVIVEKEYHQVTRGDDWWRGHLFQRVREDLDHVQAVTEPFSADEYRLGKVKEELNELQGKYESKGYDQPEMDDVIGTLERVVRDNHLSGRDRDMLTADLNRLREFREHHDGYR
jgi:hypothetical protein